ncbi:threonine ammonia-lyase IlvA [Corynebacterium sp. ES2794-CONJ1]|uniref:threonine ammonia-lyase IlvA n=1 Tax=unclassified Corynebacterium TaxID=2624378 RepID=UPI002166EA35|nr:MULTISPECIES: threonine ammonia-lyase IlvA [unclassified Corynebacterium]MCS4489037.1 threonine ammonia-lyase IlvA [Corynebacterium sp. ES2775-CONJ]MCS4490850.1 threonine ammonia-lyase IlvA [Corynebacterium sp. ES2715-CONJ3]MCS4531267.1 threonine ammonia-lyase IlvA [Corynebacterium sp. ES2730-CONJ]MCU9518636.1 threonine ammonia-lyase IlvA [Corynebacterium sp. ES2794-CONJ1]
MSTPADHSPAQTPVNIHAADIQIAQARISATIGTTPLQFCPRLSQLTGAEIYLKREDLQDVRSYKIRGAVNAISQLSDEQKKAGIVAASAGNHAQGVAFACRTKGINGRIFVPSATPKQKRDRIMVHGGENITLEVTGANFDEASAAAHHYALETGATIIEPFDAANTVIGQGTVAAEILSQLSALGKTLDTIVVPVGGGGLISGILSYLADLSPRTAVVGVEPKGAPSLEAALKANGPVTLPAVDPFVDGAAVKRIGDINYQVIEQNLGRLHPLTVSEGVVCTEMIELYQNEGIIAEPAGALSVAALRDLKFGAGDIVVCVISGGNNDVLRYSEIVERSLVQRGLKHYFLVSFPQEPGQLRSFLNDILGPDDDITLFEYLKRNNRETGTALVGLQLGSASDIDGLKARMDASRITCRHLEPGTPEYEFVVS